MDGRAVVSSIVMYLVGCVLLCGFMEKIMIHAEIGVNGMPIGIVQVVNTCELTDVENVWVYDYRIIDEHGIKKGTVVHNRTEPWTVLYEKVLKDCNK